MNVSLPDLTPSRVAAIKCPKRFHDEFVLRAAPITWKRQLAFGNAIHTALKRLLDPSETVAPQDRPLEAIVRRAFLEEYYPDTATRQADAELACSFLREYIGGTSDDDEVLGVEVHARCRVKLSDEVSVGMAARFDLLCVRQSEPAVLRVRDYKVSTPRGVNLSAACVAYVVAKANLRAFSSTYGRSFSEVQIEYEFIGDSGQLGRLSLCKHDVRIVWEELQGHASSIYSATDYPPQPGEHCALCPFRNDCSAQLSRGAIAEIDLE